MSDIESRYFVRSFIRYLNKQIAEDKFTPDSIESLEVAIQCLENVFEISPAQAEGGASTEDKDNPLNNFNLYDLYKNALLTVTPERKEQAEKLKNDG